MTPTPGFEIQTENLEDFCAVICHGLYHLANAKRVYSIAFQRASEHPRQRALIDSLGVAGVPSVVDRYELGMFQAELQQGCPPGVKVALVGREPLIDPHRLAQTVARNRGANVAVFTDREEAVAWLVERS